MKVVDVVVDRVELAGSVGEGGVGGGKVVSQKVVSEKVVDVDGEDKKVLKKKSGSSDEAEDEAEKDVVDVDGRVKLAGSVGEGGVGGVEGGKESEKVVDVVVDMVELAGSVRDGNCVSAGLDEIVRYLSGEDKKVVKEREDEADDGEDKKVSGSSDESEDEADDEEEKEREAKKEVEVVLGWKRVLAKLSQEGKLENILKDATDPDVNPCINAAVSGT